jgi:hypothetical protein
MPHFSLSQVKQDVNTGRLYIGINHTNAFPIHRQQGGDISRGIRFPRAASEGMDGYNLGHAIFSRSL